MKMELNKIYCGDALEVLKTFPDNCVDLAVTSPPYNIGKKYQFYKDNLTIDEYFDWSKNVIKECLRITKNQVFWNVQLISNNKQAIFRLLGYFEDLIKEIIIWDKKHGEPAIQESVMNSVWEFILILDKTDANRRMFKNAQFLRGTMDNILRIGKNTENRFNELNAACFPKDLPGKIIKNFSKEDEIILDPFMGSGTTAVVAKELKRNFIGIEIDENQIEIIKQRLAQDILL